MAGRRRASSAPVRPPDPRPAAATVASAALRAASSASARAASSVWRRASSSAVLRASSSRLRASSAADRIEIFSCSRRSASRRAASRCCSTSARWRAACSVAVSARGAAGVACATAGGSAACGRCRRAGSGGTRRGAARRPAWCADRGALLAHLDLHDLRPAVAETLPHGAGVDRTAELQASRGPQREPALAGVLIVAFAHLLPAGPVRL